MVHFGTRKGAPLHDERGGLIVLLDGAHSDPRALQDAGVDAMGFGNEKERRNARLVNPERAGVLIAQCCHKRRIGNAWSV